ncbi:MAG TPA: hypothetical protein VLS25_06465 [Dehalococcoidia bacterium]|nr:hypothetical protein [Dehalococcoidia bacterium]
MQQLFGREICRFSLADPGGLHIGPAEDQTNAVVGNAGEQLILTLGRTGRYSHEYREAKDEGRTNCQAEQRAHFGHQYTSGVEQLPQAASRHAETPCPGR